MIRPESASLFYDLMMSPLFVAALTDLVEDQKIGLVAYLRSCVASGDIGGARQAEGSIQALEDLPGVIAQYAAQTGPDIVRP